VGHQTKPGEAAEPAREGNSQAQARPQTGWWVAVVVWALAFGGLMLSELWDLLWKGVRRLF
jgi:hypothetical protein